MFCPVCGNQLKNSKPFCPYCGSQINPSQQQTYQSEPAYNPSVQYNAPQNALNLGNAKNLLLASIALLILSAIFAVTPVLKVDAILGISENMGMFDEVEGLKTVSIIAYIVSGVCLLFPLMSNKNPKSVFLLCAKVTTVLNLAWFLIVFFTGTDEVSSSMYSSVAEFAISVTGWLFLATTVGCLIVLFKLTSDIKKQQVM